MQDNIKDEVNKLMSKDMDRKDFLKHVGIGFAGIIGVTSALKTIGNMSGSSAKSGYGYGSSVYGGRAAAVSSSAMSPTKARA